jgi:two-component system, OmpR family, response regulator
MRLLLVEDDPALANSTTRALQSQGWTVDWSTPGEPVPQSVTQDHCDSVILDVGLAGIDGFETLRRMRAQGSSTPVLMVAFGPVTLRPVASGQVALASATPQQVAP